MAERGMLLAAAVMTTALPLSAGASPAPSPTGAPDLVGQAFDGRGRPAYVEEHHYLHEGAAKRAAHTLYRDTGGAVIAEMHASYHDRIGAPAYRMRDLRFDWEHLAEHRGDRIFLSRRQGAKLETREVAAPRDAPVLIGPGFNDFIVERWDELAAGRSLRCYFALPARLQLVKFRIEKAGRPSVEGAVRFRVRLDNPVLNLLVDALHVEYDAGTRALAAYEGLSNVADARDQRQSVRIVFPRLSPATDAATLTADARAGSSGLPASAQ